MKYKSFTPGDIFVPGLDPGMECIGAPDWMWRTGPRARIHGIALSDHPAQRDRCRSFLNGIARDGTFAEAIEFNTLPVAASDVTADGRALLVGGKAVLNGAHGARLRNRIVWKKGLEDGHAFDRALVERFGMVAQLPEMNRPLPVGHGPMPSDMVVECRNGFNYYHFLTETLSQLCLAVETGFHGRVRIHAPRGEVKGFVAGFIAALFPELAGRVDVVPGEARHYDRALIGLNTRHLLAMSGPGMMPGIEALVPGGYWPRRADRDAWPVLARNGFDRNLRMLRERALRLAGDIDIRRMPRRIWVARNPDFSARRPMKNAGKLFRALSALGFRKVVFEDLAPLDQVAMMANADVVVMAHGAGLANMMFARPDATVIELSNLQTLLARFGDFHAHAHIAGCRYISAVCDHNIPDPATVPDMMDGHAGVRISEAAIGQLVDTLRAILAPDTVADVPQTARLLHDAGAGDLLGPVLGRAAGDPDLFVWRANLHAEAGRADLALADLLAARDLAPDRAELLERIVRLSNRLGQRDRARAMMALHRRDFPERQAAFLANCPWLMPLVEPGADARPPA